MREWQFLLDGRCEPGYNMHRDTDLFKEIKCGSAVGYLRIYNWQRPAVTIGYHQKSFKPYDTGLRIPIVPRPTGGGAVLHVDDLTFSISVSEKNLPDQGLMESYALLTKPFAYAFNQCGFDAKFEDQPFKFSEICFARSAPKELTIDGRKIMGAAQLRRKGCLLQQGVIPLRTDQKLARQVFGPGFLSRQVGIFELWPDFSLEQFIAHLRDGFAAEMDVFFTDAYQNETQYKHTYQSKIDSGRN